MNKFSLFLFGIGLFFILPAYAQDNNQLTKDSLVKIGNDWCNKGNVYYLTNPDSVIFYYQKAIPFYKEAKKWDYYITILNACANKYYEKEDFENMEHFSLLAMAESLRYFNKESIFYTDALNNLSIIHTVKGNWNKAIEIFEDILLLQSNIDVPVDRLTMNYTNIANLSSRIGDLEKAKSYSQKAISIYQQEKKIDPIILARFYATYAFIFSLDDQIDSSNIYNFKIIDRLKNVAPAPLKTELLIDAYHNLVKNSLTQNDLKNARYYLNKTLLLQQKDNTYHKGRSYEFLAYIHLKNKQLEAAETAIKKGISLIKKYSDIDLPGIAQKQALLGDILIKQGKYDQAIQVYHQALSTISNTPTVVNVLELPTIDRYVALPKTLTILEKKGSCLQQYYEQTNDVKYLDAALETYETAIQIIKRMRQELTSIESKNTISEKNIPIFEGAINACYELYEKTKEEKYLNRAFSFAERNKAQLLLESFNEQIAQGFSNVPDSLLQKLKDLNADLAFYNKKIITLQQDPENQDQLSQAEAIIFERKQQIDQLNQLLESSYPRYFDLKYKNEIVEVAEVQNYLQRSKKAFLQYFIGEESIYLFTLTSSDLNIHKVANDLVITQQVENFRTILNNPPTAGFDLEDYNNFTNLAHQLYQELINPIIGTLDNNVNELSIIPDYFLNYIPFDVLLSSLPKAPNGSFSLEALDYFFEDFIISYDYSVTLHLKKQSQPDHKYQENFIGFAPSFNTTKQLVTRSCTSDELYSLKCSNQEISDIVHLVNGKKFLNLEATRQNFELQIKGHRIVHLATHACIDESNNQLNKIFLTDDFLSDADLFNMELDAELAVLSACNTGSGKLIKGEGVMSLARGFINAGCSSTLISMWSVDDCATSDIMRYFYEGLKEKQTKNLALKNARIKYLNSVDKSKSHPYYWSAFVAFGDMDKMNLSSQTNFLYYIIPIACLLLIGLFFFRKK